ncbi:MAG: hypothetical protein MZW92_46650 [Comamonadaceae bacterium]|nr:hypothetical protein [Comamonadaceae bacterium]
MSVLYFLVMRGNNEGNARKLAVLGSLLALGTADLHRLRPHGAPEPSGVEHAADAGAVRRACRWCRARPWPPSWPRARRSCSASLRQMMLWSAGGGGGDADLAAGHHGLRRRGRGTDLHAHDHRHAGTDLRRHRA